MAGHYYPTGDRSNAIGTPKKTRHLCFGLQTVIRRENPDPVFIRIICNIDRCYSKKPLSFTVCLNRWCCRTSSEERFCFKLAEIRRFEFLVVLLPLLSSWNIKFARFPRSRLHPRVKFLFNRNNRQGSGTTQAELDRLPSQLMAALDQPTSQPSSHPSLFLICTSLLPIDHYRIVLRCPGLV